MLAPGAGYLRNCKAAAAQLASMPDLLKATCRAQQQVRSMHLRWRVPAYAACCWGLVRALDAANRAGFCLIRT